MCGFVVHVSFCVDCCLLVAGENLTIVISRVSFVVSVCCELRVPLFNVRCLLFVVFDCLLLIVDC